MKVILTRDVPKVGSDGDIVNVAGGFARNYLFPRQLAVLAGGAALKHHTARVAREAAAGEHKVAEAGQAANKLRDCRFRILVKTGAHSTRLFGSVTAADVAEVILRDTGIEIDKRKVSLIDPIKVTGTYDLTLKLHADLAVPFTVDVITAEQLEAREREERAAQPPAIPEDVAAPTPEPPADTETPSEPAGTPEVEAAEPGEPADATEA